MALDTIPIEIAQRISEKWHPDRIILFGSRARGDVDEESDYDVLVVASQGGSTHDLAVDMHRALAGLNAGVDLLVTTPDRFLWRRRVVGTIEHEAARDGIVLFERTAGAVTPTAPLVPSADEIRRVAEERGERAAGDLRAARTPEFMEPGRYEYAAFWAHQCAKWALTGAFVCHQVEHGRLRTPTDLIGALASIDPALAASCASASCLTPYETATYPGGEEVTKAKAEEAVAIAGDVYEKVKEHVAAYGVEWP